MNGVQMQGRQAHAGQSIHSAVARAEGKGARGVEHETNMQSRAGSATIDLRFAV